jgi:hypothetical protein
MSQQGSQGHPFLLKLEGTLNDKDSIYFLLELVSGGDMYDLWTIFGNPLNDLLRGNISTGTHHFHFSTGTPPHHHTTTRVFRVSL